jgi:hypothetical protein
MFPLVAPVLPGYDLAAVWADAREDAKVKHEVLASLMGIPASRLSDQLAGRQSQHLSLQRVLLLATDPDGRRFLRCLCLKLATVNGFDLDCELQVAMIQRIATKLVDRIQKRVPLKADMRAEDERRSA